MTYAQFLQKLASLPTSDRAVESLLREYFTEQGIGTSEFPQLAKSIKFGLTGEVVVSQGEMAWNAEEETLDLGLNESVLQLGLETLYHAQNNTGGELVSGTPVMFEEAIGTSGRGRIAPADLSDPANVPLYLGLVTENMADADVGKITEFGRNRGINCSGSGTGKLSFGDETWEDGDSVYVDPDNAGYLTNVAPIAPKVKVRAGFVLNNHATNGTLFVISNHHDEQVAWGDRVGGNYIDIESDDMHFHGDASMVIDSLSGKGIRFETANPDFGWHDLVGEITLRGVAASDPAFTTYQTVNTIPIRQYLFDVDDVVTNAFHIQHDQAPGTDLYIHAHWSHIDPALLSGGVTWEFNILYAKGHNQAPFVGKTVQIQQDASLVQYQHMIAEIAFTNADGSGGLFDHDLIETDGLLIVATRLLANDMSDGALVKPFLHFVDIHYQSTGLPTKNKAPNFYT